MPTRNVVLTEHQVTVIESLVPSGRYRSASEVLRLIEQRESEDAARLEALRQAARIGVEALERGDYKSFDAFEELERHLVDLGETAIAEDSGR